MGPEKEIRLNAPCKINLSLEITGVRADGYHLLKSAMQTISLCDTIAISRHNGGGIRLQCGRGYPQGEDNIAYRAARLFFDRAGISGSGVTISIIKRIPMGAGLAGGSADAAAVLTGLNRLYGTPLSDKLMHCIGLSLGADVPFMLTGGTAFCEGIGEILSPLPSLPHCHIVVATPDFFISTKESYARYDLLETKKAPESNKIAAAVKSGDLHALSKVLRNVLEDAVPGSSRAVIDSFKELMLKSGALGSSMSGSGPTVFGIFDDRLKAARCLERIQNSARTAFIANPTQHGPYAV